MDATDFDAKLAEFQSQFSAVLAVIAKHPDIHLELRAALADHEAHAELSKAAQTRLAQLNAIAATFDELLKLIGG